MRHTDSVISIYRDFLSGIQKDFIGTVTPEQFNYLMGKAMTMLRQKILQESMYDTSVKSDIDTMLVTTSKDAGTDDVIVTSAHIFDTHGGTKLSMNGKFAIRNPYIQQKHSDVSLSYDAVNFVLLPGIDINSQPIAKAFHSALSIRSVMVYYDGSNTAVPCYPIRSDELHSISNTFRKPNDGKCYYELTSDVMFIHVKDDIEKIRVVINYIRNPFDLFFDRDNPDDAPYPYVIRSISAVDYSPYQNGYGSINPLLSHGNVERLISLALQEYSLVNKDEMYQFKLNENTGNIKG